MRISDWSSDVCSSDLGVTVLEARLGFGRSAHMHRRHVFENDRALLIEIVDDDAKLRSFAVALADIPDIGMMTLEPVEILGGKAKIGRAQCRERVFQYV